MRFYLLETFLIKNVSSGCDFNFETKVFYNYGLGKIKSVNGIFMSRKWECANVLIGKCANVEPLQATAFEKQQISAGNLTPLRHKIKIHFCNFSLTIGIKQFANIISFFQ